MDENKVQPQEEKIEIAVLEKDGEKVMSAIEAGGIVAMFCGGELLYTFLDNEQYQCLIHPIGSSNGRRRSYPKDDRSYAMIRDLAASIDDLFEIRYDRGMELMGVLVAAENGITEYLGNAGKLGEGKIDFTTGIGIPKQ